MSRPLPSLAIAALTLAFGVQGGACSSGGSRGPFGPAFGAPDGGGPTPQAAAPDGGAAPPTEITFDPATKFAARPCGVTVTYPSGVSQVLLASEFTNWASGAEPMTKGTSGGFSIDVEPGATVQSGQLYAYKLVADGTWLLDPGNRYRKIVGGTKTEVDPAAQMNSALMMPDCGAGPELTSSKLTATADGRMNVHVTVRAASDGAAPTKVVAAFDHAGLAAGTWKTDTSGGIDFAVTGLAKGKHTLSLQAVDGKNRNAKPIDLPFWVEDEPFDYQDGLLYMIMLDRFANGDRSNDKPVGAPVDYDADWHGGDLVGALQVLQSGYFEKLGVRTIWLSPVNEQTSKSQSGDGNQLYSAYHGYWPTKARAVEPRLGGEAALHAFVDEAHRRGIRVLIDLINNQVHQDHEYVAANPSWFRTVCQCGDDAAGCGWSVRPIDCYFQPYLPDINWTVYDAERQFIADAENWIATFDLDGFRVDAVKHVEANAIYDMRAALARRFEQGGARIFMVGETAVGEGDHGTFFGETFTDGYQWVDSYTSGSALDGQFDFPVYDSLGGFVGGTMALSDFEALMQKSLTRYKPGNHHVRFLAGHDNPRVASLAAQDPKLGCTWASGCRGAQLPPAVYTDPVVYERLKRALTAELTMPGVPYLFMGDEVAFPGGADPDMRRDMRFDDSSLASVQMTRPGTEVATLTAQQLDLRDWVRKLGQTRASSRALRRGQRTTLIGNDPDFLVYAWQSGPGEIAIVALNRAGIDQNRAVPTAGLNLTGVTTWDAAVGTGTAAGSGANVQVTLGAGQAAIFVAR
jgi:glycosidase